MELSFVKKNGGKKNCFGTALFFILFYSIFCYYIYSNLVAAELRHDSKLMLGIIACLSFSCLNFDFKKPQNYRLNYSTLSFVLFVLYFTLMCVIELDAYELWPILLGSESGIFYYYGLGIVFFWVSSRFFKWGMTKDNFNKASLTSMCVLGIGTILMSNVVRNALGRSRDEIYLVSYDDELYQWPADLLSICLIVLSVVYGVGLIANRKTKKGSRFLNIMNGALFMVLCILSIFYLQIIGSNKGVLVVLLIMVCIISLIIATCLPRFFSLKLQLKIQNKCKARIGNLLRVQIKNFIIIVLGLFVLLSLAICLGLPLDKFRLSGYGSFEISSIDSRIDLINYNFVNQFSVSPFFGNVKAEIHSGYSSGEYVHSLFLYLLTHSGVVGTLIFFSAVIFRVEEFRTFKFNELDPISELKNCDLLLNVLLMSLFVAIILVSCIATSLMWAPLWFSIGFLSPSICKKTM